MKNQNLAQIAMKICSTPWLITPDGLSMLLNIVERRMAGEVVVYEGPGGTDSRNADMFGGYKTISGVGILPICGPIFGKANMLTEMSGATSLESSQAGFRQLLADSQIHTILLDIDSPGGTSDLVQEFGDEIFASRGVKPIYAIANTSAGSAALWLGTQASKLYTTPSGMVGSLGAYTVHEDRSVENANAGRKFTYVSAGKYKTEGNSNQPLSEDGQEYRQEVINELYDDFVGAVARGRNVSAETAIANFGQGRMLTSKAAKFVNLVDGVMSYEGLMNQLVNSQRTPAGAPAYNAIYNQTGEAQSFTFTLPGFEGRAASVVQVGDDLTINVESKEYEHSEPGTGSPPAPRTDEDGHDDPAIVSGSRRSPLPADRSEIHPEAPVNSNVKDITEPQGHVGIYTGKGGGTNMNEELFAQLCGLLGITMDANAPDTLLARVTAINEESTALHAATNQVSESERMKAEFPIIWAQHNKLMDADRETRATSFVNSVARVMRPEGDSFVKTTRALSALAMDTVGDSYKKFATGHGTLADFEGAINAIMHGGIVDYSELGSDHPGAEPIEINTSSHEGLQNAKLLFAEKVREEMKAGATRADAINAAAMKHPELAAAYKVAPVVK